MNESVAVGVKLALQAEPKLSKKQLFELLDERAVELEVRQVRPYTYIAIRTHFAGGEFLGMGFSKVRYPDPWDEEKGKRYARIHALQHILREIRSA